MARRAHLGGVFAVAAVAAIACGGGSGKAPAVPLAPPATTAERMLAMLPQGAQVVVEVDLARLRANPVIGEVIRRALAEGGDDRDDRSADAPGQRPGWLGSLLGGGSRPRDRPDRPAPVPASPLAVADQLVLAAYGVGTAQAATLTVLAAPHEIAGATRIAEGFYALGPAEWVEQVEQRVALAATGESKFAIRAPSELLALRDHAMPPSAPGAALRVTARLPFDARIALARQTGLDAAPAQVSAWADVADDLAIVIDCDASDPGNAPAGARRGDAARRLVATLRGALGAIADLPIVRSLGLPSSLAGTRLVARGTWVRAIIAVGPAHLRRVVERAAGLLGAPAAPATPSSATAPRGEDPS